MRISSQKDDPGYDAFMAIDETKRNRVKIMLDGEEQHYAITADDVEGLVVRNEIEVIDGHERFILNDSRTAFLTTISYGKVEITIPE